MLLNIMESVTKSNGSSHVEEAMADAIKQGTIIIREAKEILVAPSMGREAKYWLLHLWVEEQNIGYSIFGSRSSNGKRCVGWYFRAVKEARESNREAMEAIS
jgi:hypothetical protein